MHFLDRFLHGNQHVAEELMNDEHALHTELKQFFASFEVKEQVLDKLAKGEPLHLHIHRLHQALRGELQIVEQTTQTEHEIMQDLRYLSREHYIQRLEEISVELNHAETRDEYTRHLLGELKETLLSEARKVKRALHGEDDFHVTDAIIDLLTIERHIVEKLSAIEDFQKLFGDLFVGSQRRFAVKGKEKQLYERTKELMHHVEVSSEGTVEPTEDHYLADLTARVFNKLERAVMDAVRGGYIRKHPTVDVEFVNSSLFVSFLNKELLADKHDGKFIPSQRTMQAFVSAFREMYQKPLEAAV